MELLLLLSAAIVALHSHPVKAIPVPPPSLGKCHSAAPNAKPLPGTNIYACTATELERQQIQAYDKEASQWLHEDHIEPILPPSDGSAAFPASERPRTRPEKAFVQAIEPGDRHRATDDRSLLDIFVSIYSSPRDAEVGRIEDDSPIPDDMSIFDLPSAQRESSTRKSMLQQYNQEAWDAANHRARDGVHNSSFVPLLVVLVAIGVVIYLSLESRRKRRRASSRATGCGCHFELPHSAKVDEPYSKSRCAAVTRELEDISEDEELQIQKPWR